VETILIVDDEPEVRAVARDLLQSKGFNTLDTGDPMLAIRIARAETQPIHLLLTDVVMPLMNGRELADQIRAIRPEIKILYMSAYSTDTIESYGIQIVPGQPFVMKPFTLDSIVSAVRGVLDYRSPFSRRDRP
jgi:CheY-like chemotaxis protein